MNEIEIGYDEGEGIFSFHASHLDPLPDWPGWRRRGATLVAQATPHAVLSPLATKALKVRWTDGAFFAQSRLLNSLHRATMALGNAAQPRLPPFLPTPRRPMPHQWQAISALPHMLSAGGVLLADEMGLGKTATALWAALDHNATRLVVVCPVSVKWNWSREITVTLGKTWGRTTFVVDGGRKKRAGVFAEIRSASSASEMVAVILNYDILQRLTGEQQDQLSEFAAGAFVILDESHYIKSRTAKRTILVHDLFKHSAKRLALTGTPVRNLADDLYSQIEWLRPGTWTSYWDFRRRYLVVNEVSFGGPRKVAKVVGTKNLKNLNAIINTLQIRRRKGDVLDLPPKVVTTPALELNGPIAALYRVMKTEARYAIQEVIRSTTEPLTIWDPRARSAIEGLMRCEQIAQGFIGGIPVELMDKVSDDIHKHAERIPGRPHELIFPAASKIAWMIETIDSIRMQGGAPVVFSRFNAPLFWLEKQIHRCAILHGGLEAAAKDAVIEEFQSGAKDVLLVQVKMAEGFNLTRSSDVLFLGRDWSPAVNLQAEDRCHRIGQKGTVNVQIPIVLHTVEVAIDARLQSKQRGADSALATMTLNELLEVL